MRSFFALAAGVFAFPAAMFAQTSAGLDLAGARISYEDGAQLNAASLSPFFIVLGPSSSLSANATYSMFDTGGWTAQGAIGASVLTPAFRFARGELLGDLSGSTHEDGTRTSGIRGAARAHVAGLTRGAWIGGGAGSASDGMASRTTVFGDIGAWAQNGPAVFQLTITPTRIADDLRYTDGEASISWFGDRTDFYASAGARAMEGGGTAWGSASGTFWVLPSVGLIASAGRYPTDLTQTLPGGNYFSLALRLMRRARGATVVAVEPQRELPVARPPLAADDEPAFELLRAADGSRRLRFRLDASRSVEMMGDFTDWKPRRLTRVSADLWQLDATIPAGLHKVNLRVDSGDWIVPPGLTGIKDEFGGEVGILVIP